MAVISDNCREQVYFRIFSPFIGFSDTNNQSQRPGISPWKQCLLFSLPSSTSFFLLFHHNSLQVLLNTKVKDCYLACHIPPPSFMDEILFPPDNNFIDFPQLCVKLSFVIFPCNISKQIFIFIKCCSLSKKSHVTFSKQTLIGNVIKWK